MSRIANNPILVPSSVDVSIVGSMVTVKGDKGELSHNIHPLVKVEQKDNVLNGKPTIPPVLKIKEKNDRV